MLRPPSVEAIDYLIVGHIALDITPHGLRLGGTAAYSALTARALGQRVGLVTSWGAGEQFGLLLERGVQILSIPAEKTTIFENIATPHGRIQRIESIAQPLTLDVIPAEWRIAPLVHLAPIAQEIEPEIANEFPESLVLATVQGWLRRWDAAGHISPADWRNSLPALQKKGVIVMSEEDVQYDEAVIAAMAAEAHHLVVTCGSSGARVFIAGEQYPIAAPSIAEVDATGAGDIFAAAYAIHYQRTQDPFEAAVFANRLAADSVTRCGLASIPLEV
ncbi:MAG: ribokinase [Chloroflexi bacterium]|jgi:sugar/nucleoside kinase (ribokinase family)|nr:ribokinase [Chloroflexota bacterium]